MSAAAIRAAAAGVVALWLGGCVATDDRPATWSYISTEIVQPSCGAAGCHSQLTQTAGIILDTRADGYRTLVTNPPDLGGPFVVAGDPDSSQLLFLLRGDEIKRMPPDGPLPTADIDLISQWISDGATDQ